MVSTEAQKPLCPVCHRGDQVKTLRAAYESGIARFAPPSMPERQVSMMRNMSIGMAIVGISSFFIIILVGSGSFGQGFSWIELVLVAVILLAIIAALVLSFLAFQNVVQNDLETQKYYPAWDRAMATWGRLYYCSRDDAVFDPQTGKKVSQEELASLMSPQVQQAQQQSASLAHH